MTSRRKWFFGFLIVSWSCAVVLLAWWAGSASSKPVTTGDIPAVPWLPCLGGFFLCVLVLIIVSKSRLAILSMLSLMLASILTAFWIGSAHAQFMARYLTPTRVDVVADERYVGGGSLTIRAAKGGIGIGYDFSTFSDAPPGRTIRDRAEFALVKYRTGGPMSYPGWGGYGFRGIRPIPTFAGFNSAWLTVRTPLVPKAVNTRAMYALVTPFWFPILLCMIFPAVSLRRFRRQRYRLRHNLCLTCGYDLRAHATSAKCPECGTPVSAPKPDASNITQLSTTAATQEKT